MEKMKVKENSYITVQAFMVNELKLKGNELLIYAIIYGFSQDDVSWFEGSRGYLAEWCGASKSTVSRYLEQLCKKGLIEKRSRVVAKNVTMNDYRAVRPIQNEHAPIQNEQGGRTQNDNPYTRNKYSSKTIEEKTPVEQVEEFTNDEELKNALLEFLKFRSQTKKDAVTSYGMKRLLFKLSRLSKRTDEQRAIVDEAIMRGWKGFFPLDKDRGRVKSWNEEANRAKKPEDYDDWEW